MTTWFVSRHTGAVDWLRRRGLAVDSVVQALHPGMVSPGDTVIGTLPAHLAGEVCARGGRYFHLVMDVPLSMRGGELSADDMDRYGARAEEYRVERVASDPPISAADGKGS
ncbi:MAG: CRISPR-associated protein Csx16 [Planctomycetota bacterium]|jgi:CRISPR-associated protein Csx16|nr:CRISPR-associated protein Csx16 [Planctomycetota bacterium]